jgi:hypothetical protein
MTVSCSSFLWGWVSSHPQPEQSFGCATPEVMLDDELGACIACLSPSSTCLRCSACALANGRSILRATAAVFNRAAVVYKEYHWQWSIAMPESATTVYPNAVNRLLRVESLAMPGECRAGSLLVLSCKPDGPSAADSASRT